MSPSKSLCDRCGYSPLAGVDAQIPEAVSAELCSFPSKHRLDQRPLIIASFCRTWRNATLALPTIWSDIRIHIRMVPKRAELWILRIWLQRSGDHPLSVNISSDSEVEHVDNPTLDLIISTSSRWKELYIRDVAPRLHSGLLDSSHDYQMLHSLEFTSSPSPYSFEISRNTPLLRTLTIHRPSAERLGIPWAQLQHLSFRGTEGQLSSNSQAILDILALTANLHTLTMPYYVQGPLNYNPRSIHMPNLSKLALRVSRGLVIGPPADIFTALDLPVLKHVSFEVLASADRVAWRTSTDLLVLLSRSPVSCLIITAHGKSKSSPSDEDLVKVLQALPGLKGLHLLGTGIRCTTKSLFNRLSYKPDVPILVLLLKYISFRTKQLEHEVDIASFVDAMESRAKHQPNVLQKFQWSA
ncbi:hypothetical protein FIBSPDRAFT_936242 [Athelia psychrophila]|uniref:F-box domain-containing protein n=1 Tax=Athelia psychrophila TaxID=1759441 RepID=A0A166CFN3_9AGAM|nr:hypothetical protein FIBSPDRAFT_936242 [Fibularhizoctonia sp. CBS 109695]